MTIIRVLETQLIGKEGEFDEFGDLFLSCWMQALMLSGSNCVPLSANNMT